MRGPESKPIGLDEALTVLSNQDRRRLLVGLLDDDSQPIRVDEVVAAEAADADRDSTRLQIAMHHNHLPKLDAWGYIDWDVEVQEITPGPKFGEIRPVLELLDTHAAEIPVQWP
ncbi:ArsR family transcriptional regulator [Haloferax namakaokahaiae]|uniref:ArsR family transcriptional regulator n=1 Tax=Haloferax namakaokahaiae TaxID=1748331 RepID=A0ABD5ZG52_9EURY